MKKNASMLRVRGNRAWEVPRDKRWPRILVAVNAGSGWAQPNGEPLDSDSLVALNRIARATLRNPKPPRRYDPTRCLAANIPDVRCTTATLLAFGIMPKMLPRWGSSVVDGLGKAGHEYRPFGMGTQHREAELAWIGKTLRAFVAAHPSGKYVVSTRGHSMALIDGVLTDTTLRGADGRRVETIAEIDGVWDSSPIVIE